MNYRRCLTISSNYIPVNNFEDHLKLRESLIYGFQSIDSECLHRQKRRSHENGGYYIRQDISQKYHGNTSQSLRAISRKRFLIGSAICFSSSKIKMAWFHWFEIDIWNITFLNSCRLDALPIWTCSFRLWVISVIESMSSSFVKNFVKFECIIFNSFVHESAGDVLISKIFVIADNFLQNWSLDWKFRSWKHSLKCWDFVIFFVVEYAYNSLSWKITM